MTPLTQKHIDFLRAVQRGGRLGLADREADRVRQRCRQEGFAEVLKNPRRWSITEKGVTLLEEHEDEFRELKQPR